MTRSHHGTAVLTTKVFGPPPLSNNKPL